MAKKRQEEPKKGAPAWQSTFSDLMNLLLCFFVLLFSMSTVDAEKFEMVIASLQSSMSILPAGGSAIGDGNMVSAGVNQLEFLDSYYNDLANSQTMNENDVDGEEKDVSDAYKEQELAESEQMAEEVQNAVNQYGLQDLVEVDFNAEYVRISLSGAILFESGSAEFVPDAKPVLDKISKILDNYDKNVIEVEGHTDNVPIVSPGKYEDNDVLSMYRALNVADYIRDASSLNPAHIKSSGRGEYMPVADNSTAEGRALNRRVEIKIYNSYNSDLPDEE
ncbi:MAG: flagellar motor protein MotB [Agathobacter sp.]|nr:flagellar motor protein MotB [Lachnobacterium sp.]MDY2912118.1 flagellar motor protein MotB [Agathobacter sp.]